MSHNPKNFKGGVKMKKTLLISLVCFAVVASWTSKLAWAQVLELRAANEFPPVSFMQKDIFEPWAAEVNKATQGRVKIVNFYAESLGKAVDAFDNTVSGICDIAEVGHEYTPGRFTLSMVYYLPFLGANSAKAVSLALCDLYNEFPEIRAGYPGVKVLSLWATPAFQFLTKKKPIKSLADVKGVKIRCGGGPVVPVLKATGAAVVVMGAGSAYEALEKGTIDGTFFPIGDSFAFTLGDVVKYCTEVNMINTSFGLIMNENSWKKLSPADQDALSKLSGTHFAKLAGSVWDANESTGKKGLQKQGVQFIKPSPQALAQFQEATASLVNKWATEMEAKGLPGKKIIARAKELATKHSK
jgi:TRAP-type C4-dicarboxylate transport system substrate-binding protein